MDVQSGFHSFICQYFVIILQSEQMIVVTRVCKQFWYKTAKQGHTKGKFLSITFISRFLVSIFTILDWKKVCQNRVCLFVHIFEHYFQTFHHMAMIILIRTAVPSRPIPFSPASSGNCKGWFLRASPPPLAFTMLVSNFQSYSS